MRFRTELAPDPANWAFDHQSKVCLLGSCFATSIGQTFAKAKIPTLINPWGTIYHSAPLLANIKSAISKTLLHPDGYIRLGSRMVHLAAHSDLSADTSDNLTAKFTSVNEDFRERLSQISIIFITLGSAWHYKHRELNLIVANCHKQPNADFDRVLSTPDEIQTQLSELITSIREVNPHINIVLTVSPVRHIRDGLIANNRSKSHLITACHMVSDTTSDTHYFPSFELLMDDLRDYRYYGDDLIHPSEMAVEYIWDYLVEHHTSTATQHLLRRCINISKSIDHRPVDPHSPNYRSFLVDLQSKMVELQDRVDYTGELKQVQFKLDQLPA